MSWTNLEILISLRVFACCFPLLAVNPNMGCYFYIQNLMWCRNGKIYARHVG